MSDSSLRRLKILGAFIAPWCERSPYHQPSPAGEGAWRFCNLLFLLCRKVVQIPMLLTRAGVCNSGPDVLKQVKPGCVVWVLHIRYGRVYKTRPALESQVDIVDEVNAPSSRVVALVD